MVIIDEPAPKLRDEDKWSANFKDFVSKCLNKQPHERPSAIELFTVCMIACECTVSSLTLCRTSVAPIHHIGRRFEEHRPCRSR
jgi:serine/threonine protein kinase